jgi:hypothetical protein
LEVWGDGACDRPSDGAGAVAIGRVLRQRWRYSVWWFSEGEDDNGGVSCGDNQPAVEERRAGEGRVTGHQKSRTNRKATQVTRSARYGWLVVVLVILWWWCCCCFVALRRKSEGGDEVPVGTGTCVPPLAAAMMAAAANGLRTVVRWWK